MEKKKLTASERGEKDYKEGVRICPYPKNTKSAERWNDAWDMAQMRSMMEDGAFDDGGTT